MEKPEPKLSHMPSHIKQKITDKAANIGAKTLLRQVSKEFHDHAEKSPMDYVGFTIKLHAEKVILNTSEIVVSENHSSKKKLVMEFSAHEDGVLQRNPASDWTKVIPGDEDYRKKAIQYALEIMGRPGTTINELKLEVDSEMHGEDDDNDDGYSEAYPQTQFEYDRRVILTEMERILDAFRRQLHVKKVTYEFQLNESQILKVLSYLQPGTLTNIEFFRQFPRIENIFLNFERISETPQWKQAKVLVVSMIYQCSIPFESLLHFEEVSACMEEVPAPVVDIIDVFLGHPNIKKFCLTLDNEYEIPGVEAYLQEFEPIGGEDEDDDLEEFFDIEFLHPTERGTRISVTVGSPYLTLTREQYATRYFSDPTERYY